ncbi:alpha/beta hydrolase [Niameybacter massiliensis]|uniref:Alpha/beta hydrolase n=1 Tax=Holtiella tumoricola TaxID=3018743 RepID=A0AA42IYT6_9FIRM|nr:alpha/beta hydrolase [Holtiella tumoricola]MDA3730157.1 alpha/beta hydrolase [Holtiella tumoricola]
MKKFKKIIIGIIVFILLIGTIAVGFGANYLYDLALNPYTSKDLIFGSDDEDSDDAVNQNETSGVSTIDDQTWLLEHSGYEDLFMTSRDGLKLHNYVLTQPNSNKWMITVHGYTSEGVLMAPYARKFYDMGYNVIIPDLRSHGQSEGDYIGMGWDERFDIIDLVSYIVENNHDAQITLFGVSMGAATVMNVSGEELPSNVKAVIEDCGYTSVWDQFAYQLDDLFGLPAFPMMHTASLVGKLRAGYWIGEASSIEQVKKSITPTLFIHGNADDFVPYFMLDELYAASNAEKEKLVIEGAGHAKSKDVNPELYWSTITNFLDKYVD